MSKKILVISSARWGKDTFAELLNEYHGITFKSSSEAANELFIFDKLKDKYGYATLEECFEDRLNHRKEWYDFICAYNKDDRSRLAKNITDMVDCYVGMRDLDEFNASKELFDYIIWIDASERLPKEDTATFNIGKHQADFIIENNGTLDEFKIKVKKIGKLLI
jgi:dephospho-CoA kinase